MFDLKNPNDLKAPFDLVQFPSLGLFYQDKRSGVLVKYLSGTEENILTAPSLAATGWAMNMALDSLIMDKGVNVDELLVGDRNAILMYLRSTSFGDQYPVQISCPKCNDTGQTHFYISSMAAKDIVELPDDNGEYTYVMPKMKIDKKPVEIKFKPLTVFDERNILYEIEMEKYNRKALPKHITIKYKHQIVSINGIKDKEYITKVSTRFPIEDSAALRSYIERIEPGIDSKVRLQCQHCQYSFLEDFKIDAEFLGLTPEYKNSLWEQNFLLTYYSNGGVGRDEAMDMSTAERRWRIERIKEEIDKKNEAEKKAHEAASRGK